MEETSEELPNFSIGIDLLGPDPTSNKNGAGKNIASCTFRKFVGGPAAENFGRKTDIHWEQKKVTNWSLTTFKGKLSVFTVVFKFVQPRE